MKQPELYTTLQERFPIAFPADRRPFRPLKIGIHLNLAEALGPGREAEIRDCLRYHTGSIAYQKALMRYRPRLALEGSIADEVSDEQQAHARESVERYRTRKAAAQVEQKAAKTKPLPGNDAPEPALPPAPIPVERIGWRPGLGLKKTVAV